MKTIELELTPEVIEWAKHERYLYGTIFKKLKTTGISKQQNGCMQIVETIENAAMQEEK